MQKIFFSNSFNEKLSGVLELPEHEHNAPLAILCHGFGGSKENPYILDISKKLNESNIASFFFDFNAHGESQGDFFHSKISRWVDDLKSAFEAARGFKKIDFSRTGLFGFSLGGMAALLASPMLKPKCLVAAATISDFKTGKWSSFLGKQARDWKSKGFVKLDGKNLSYNFFLDGNSKDVYSEAKLIRCPTLIIHGAKDSIVPVSQAKKLFMALKCEKKLEIIKEAGHSGLNENQYNHFLSETTKWLSEHLLD